MQFTREQLSRELISIQDAATILDCNEKTIRRRILSREIEPVAIVSGVPVLLRSEVVKQPKRGPGERKA